MPVRNDYGKDARYAKVLATVGTTELGDGLSLPDLPELEDDAFETLLEALAGHVTDGFPAMPRSVPAGTQIDRMGLTSNKAYVSTVVGRQMAI